VAHSASSIPLSNSFSSTGFLGCGRDALDSIKFDMGDRDSRKGVAVFREPDSVRGGIWGEWRLVFHLCANVSNRRTEGTHDGNIYCPQHDHTAAMFPGQRFTSLMAATLHWIPPVSFEVISYLGIANTFVQWFLAIAVRKVRSVGQGSV
jgi:hypothetical protein